MSSPKYPLRRTPPDLVWLRDSRRKVAIQVDGWQSEPHHGSVNFYAPYFYRHDSPSPWLVGRACEWPEGDFVDPPPVRSRVRSERGRFLGIHAEILNGIVEGRWQKVVPFESEVVEFATALSWRMFPTAFTGLPDQFAYGFQVRDEGMCGITPEILFEVDADRLKTMALAGTGSSDGPALLDDTKEKLEHDLVIEHIVSALQGLGEVSVHATGEKVYGHLKHLRTPIEVRLNQPPQFSDLVNRLHPTAALGGLPRQQALDFLRLRGGERGRFGAPFGYVDGAQMLCVVAIRGVQWCGSRAVLRAGCGVVAGSQAEREWDEMNLKRSTAARQLGLDL